MSFLKSLFGGKSAAKSEPAVEPVAYNGFTIRAAPYASEGQYQTAGTIEKEIDGVLKQHRFVRADRHASLESAVSFTVDKARQIVDLQGERIFD
jgi:hypothetical protein